MAYNHHNEYCWHSSCKDEYGDRTFLYKGEGVRLFSDGDWRTFCPSCAQIRKQNKQKHAKQMRLF
jgi:hypothetical protein